MRLVRSDVSEEGKPFPDFVRKIAEHETTLFTNIGQHRVD